MQLRMSRRLLQVRTQIQRVRSFVHSTGSWISIPNFAKPLGTTRHQADSNRYARAGLARPRQRPSTIKRVLIQVTPKLSEILPQLRLQHNPNLCRRTEIEETRSEFRGLGRRTKPYGDRDCAPDSHGRIDWWRELLRIGRLADTVPHGCRSLVASRCAGRQIRRGKWQSQKSGGSVPERNRAS